MSLGIIPAWQYTQPLNGVNAINLLGGLGAEGEPMSPVWTFIRAASMAASTYHGYKRHESIGWAVGWGLLGWLIPIIVPAIGVGQGFGKRKRG